MKKSIKWRIRQILSFFCCTETYHKPIRSTYISNTHLPRNIFDEL